MKEEFEKVEKIICKSTEGFKIGCVIKNDLGSHKVEVYGFTVSDPLTVIREVDTTRIWYGFGNGYCYIREYTKEDGKKVKILDCRKVEIKR
ncbi:MAG: hypothetical protein ACTSWZ_07675 [Candidatus Heimdallarchaeaceae archaeon]